MRRLLAPGAALLACTALLAISSAQQAPSQLWVAAQTGADDAQHDGSRDQPLRSITRALELAGARTVDIHIGPGLYGGANGERFPLQVRGGTRLLASPGATLETADAPLLLQARPGPGALRLSGLALRKGPAGTTGLPARGTGLAVELVGGERLTLELAALSLVGFERGLRLQAAAGAQLTAALDGLVAEDCATGLWIEGLGSADIFLSNASFARGGDGLCIAGLEPDPARPTLDGQQLPALTLDLRLEDCSFRDGSGAGLRRRGEPGARREGRFSLARCRFEGNDVGLELEIPNADLPLVVRDSLFAGNRSAGLRLTGREGGAAQPTRIEHCTLRANGVGLQAINFAHPLELESLQATDNLGNGLFLASFTGRPMRVSVQDSLLARNGHAGLSFVADAQNFELTLSRLTLAHNLDSGLERKHRHGGTSALSLSDSIVFANGTDFVRIEAKEVRRCLLTPGGFTPLPEAGCWIGDPEFAAPERGDWTPAQRTPAWSEADSPQARLVLGATPWRRDAR